MKMTTAQVVETGVTVNNNSTSPIQDYVHPGDHTQPSYENNGDLNQLRFHNHSEKIDPSKVFFNF